MGGWGVDATRQRQNLLRTGYAKTLGASRDPDAIPLFRDFVAQKGRFQKQWNWGLKSSAFESRLNWGVNRASIDLQSRFN